MDLDPRARRMLELTRQARSPTPRDKARLDQLLASVLVPGASVAHAVPAQKSMTTAVTVKWTGIVVFALAGSAALFGWRASRNEASAAMPTPITVQPTAAADPVVTTPLAEPEQLTPKALAPRIAARPVVQTKLDTGTLPQELDLLHDAQSKWRAGNAEGALSLLAVHRKRFPHSQLAAERDALAVVSLCATHQEAEARKVAHRFLKTAKSSPLKTSVEESCAK
jgi:hypothetical protein